MCCKKVELLVGRGELEVLALVVLALAGHRAVLAHHRVARFLAKRRIGQHHVEAPAIVAGQRIALHHRAAAVADAMQVEVHRAQAHHLIHDVHAPERRVAQRVQPLPVLGLRLHVVVGGEQKAAGAAGRVADGLADLRIHAAHDGLDHRPRREVLPGAGFHLGGVLLQQALVDLALHIHAKPNPRAFPVDQAHQPLEFGGVGKLVLRLAEDGADQPVLTPQRLQRVAVLQLQRVAIGSGDLPPAPLRRNGRGLAEQVLALGVHLQEQQIGDLLDVIAVGNALIAQHVRVVPHLGNELFVGHCVESWSSGVGAASAIRFMVRRTIKSLALGSLSAISRVSAVTPCSFSVRRMPS